MTLTAALVAACGTPSGGQAQPPPTATASLAPSSSPSPLGIPLRAPNTFAAVTSEGRIALVSRATSKVARYLTAALPGGGPSELAPTADRNTIYFSRGDGTCAGHLAAVAVEGGAENALQGSGLRGPEQWPAARPAGNTIAFVRFDCATHQESLILAGLGSRSEQRFPGGSIAYTSWNHDGTSLAYSDVGTVWVVDVNPSGTVTRSHRLPAVQGCLLTHATFVPETQLLTVAQACGPEGPAHQVKIVEVDPLTGEVRKLLLTLRSGMDLVSMSFDATGQFLLYASTASVPSGTVISQASPVQLYWFANGQAELISADSPYRDAVW